MDKQTFSLYNIKGKAHAKVYLSNSFILKDGIVNTCKGIVEKKGKTFIIHRYVPFSRIYTEIKNNTLTFISPQKWPDPFEKYTFEKNRLEVNGQALTHCLCFTYNSVHGEEREWKAYQKPNEPIVRVSFDFHRLLLLLGELSVKENVDFYVSLMNYDVDRKDFKKCLREIHPSSMEDCVNKMSLKRKAFDDEKEIRIFVVQRQKAECTDQKTEEEKRSGIKTFEDVNLRDCITKVLLPPIAPFNDYRDPYYSDIQDIMNLGMRRFFEDFFTSKLKDGKIVETPSSLNRKILQSRLYET